MGSTANIGIDIKEASRHKGTQVNAMLGKDTAAGEESDLWGQLVGWVGQSGAL